MLLKNLARAALVTVVAVNLAACDRRVGDPHKDKANYEYFSEGAVAGATLGADFERAVARRVLDAAVMSAEMVFEASSNIDDSDSGKVRMAALLAHADERRLEALVRLLPSSDVSAFDPPTVALRTNETSGRATLAANADALRKAAALLPTVATSEGAARGSVSATALKQELAIIGRMSAALAKTQAAAKSETNATNFMDAVESLVRELEQIAGPKHDLLRLADDLFANLDSAPRWAPPPTEPALVLDILQQHLEARRATVQSLLQPAGVASAGGAARSASTAPIIERAG